MKKLIASLFLVLSMNSFAGSQQVMQITNDIDKDVVTITVDDINGRFKAIHKVDTDCDNKLIDEAFYDLAKLYTGPAVQIRKEREVVKIRFSKSFDPMYGGSFVLDYLYSGVSGERKSITLDLGKNGTKWEVTMDNKVASKLHVVGNKKKIIGVIGISSIIIR